MSDFDADGQSALLTQRLRSIEKLPLYRFVHGLLYGRRGALRSNASVERVMMLSTLLSFVEETLPDAPERYRRGRLCESCRALSVGAFCDGCVDEGLAGHGDDPE